MKLFKKTVLPIFTSIVLTTISLNTAYANDKDVINILSDNMSITRPGNSYSTTDDILLNNLYKGLYTYSSDGTIIPALAKTAFVSDDGLTWTFELNEFYWSSGNKGCAKDFVQSYLYTLDYYNASRYQSFLYIIKNGEQYSNGEVSSLEVGVRAVNENTLEITLTKPIPQFKTLLTQNYFYPIDSKNEMQNRDWFLSTENYSSNGPFKLDSLYSDENIVLSKNEYYYNKDNVKLDGINIIQNDYTYDELELYKNNEIDFIYNIEPSKIENISDSLKDELHIYNNFATYFAIFNTQEKPFNNAKVRQALSMAISRDLLCEIDTLNYVTPAYTITPVGIVDNNGNDYTKSLKEPFDEDFILAKKLLLEGLKEEGMTLSEFTFEYQYNTSDVHTEIAKLLQNMWSTNLGVNCTTENVEFSTLLENRSTSNFEIVRAGWVGDYLDPITFLELFETNNSLNNGKWSNKEYDDLINSANKNLNELERMQQLSDAENILIDDMAIIPLYHYSTLTLEKPYLKNVIIPVNDCPSFEFTYIE